MSLRNELVQKGLTNREAEVAELCAKGLSNLEVANQLFVTEKTIKFHLTNIKNKMNFKSRAQLIVWCLPYMNYGKPTIPVVNFSDFDRSLVLGNRDRINAALQNLSDAINNLKNMDQGYFAADLDQAVDCIKKYNRKLTAKLAEEQ